MNAVTFLSALPRFPGKNWLDDCLALLLLSNDQYISF